MNSGKNRTKDGLKSRQKHRKQTLRHTSSANANLAKGVSVPAGLGF